jgi:uncharacterized protein
MVEKIIKKSSFYMALAIVIASLIFAGAIEKIRQGPKTVSVRGLSEREVAADLALWSVTANATANSLPEIYQQIKTSQERLKQFFINKGFDLSELSIKQPSINDRQAQLYGEYRENQQRYIADFGILIKSDKISAVKLAIENIGELVGEGVSLASNDVQYIYTKLNDIKPEMIEEATIEARKAAEKFAKNSKSRIAGIKTAYQGLFTIEPIHYFTQDIKTVRVVTNLEYYLN